MRIRDCLTILDHLSVIEEKIEYLKKLSEINNLSISREKNFNDDELDLLILELINNNFIKGNYSQ